MSDSIAFVNGNVYTVDPTQPHARAVLVRDGRIVAIGADDEIRELAEPGTETIDLRRRLVLPGFIDAHFHLMSWALSLEKVLLDDARTLDQALDRVRQRVETTPPGEWITGRGWDHNVWGSGFPCKEDLDRVAPDHAVALTRHDGHLLWCNSRALEAAGVTADTPDPDGGQIERDRATGQPTGILKERATALVYDAIPRPDAVARQAALRRAFPIAQAAGLTGVHEMGYLEGGEALGDYQDLYARGELGLRVTMYVARGTLDSAIHVGLRSGFGDPWLRIGGVKIFMDGTVGSQTAWMLEPFEGQPDNRGIVITSAEEIRELVQRASRAGLACAVHAIGDAANRAVLDAISNPSATLRTGLQPPISNHHLRHRIEHAQIVHPDDVPRFGQLGVIASMQPIHAPSDVHAADRFWGARCRTAYAWRSLLDAGAPLALGSDCPIEPLDPLLGIHAAVTRQRADGTPEGGWYPEQCLTVEEAVRGFTIGAAYASGEEALKGSITPGKVADLVVLSQDIFQIPSRDILSTQVVGTVLDGKIVHWEVS